MIFKKLPVRWGTTFIMGGLLLMVTAFFLLSLVFLTQEGLLFKKQKLMKEIEDKGDNDSPSLTTSAKNVSGTRTREKLLQLFRVRNQEGSKVKFNPPPVLKVKKKE